MKMTMIPIVNGELRTVYKALKKTGEIGNQRKNQDHPAMLRLA